MPSTYEPIATTTLGSATATVTFSSISGSYTDLVLITQCGSTAGGNLQIRIGNGSVDTGSNYSSTYLYGSGSAASSGRASNNTYLQFQGMNNNLSGNQIIHLFNYSNTTTFKTAISRSNAADLATSSWVNLWRSTSAINIMTIAESSGGNLITGSTFTLYGIKAA